MFKIYGVEPHSTKRCCTAILKGSSYTNKIGWNVYVRAWRGRFLRKERKQKRGRSGGNRRAPLWGDKVELVPAVFTAPALKSSFGGASEFEFAPRTNHAQPDALAGDDLAELFELGQTALNRACRHVVVHWGAPPFDHAKPVPAHTTVGDEVRVVEALDLPCGVIFVTPRNSVHDSPHSLKSLTHGNSCEGCYSLYKNSDFVNQKTARQADFLKIVRSDRNYLSASFKFFPALNFGTVTAGI